MKISPQSLTFAGHLKPGICRFTLCKDEVSITIEECKERDATYAAPLKVRVRLYNKDKEEINEHEIFYGRSSADDGYRIFCY